MNKVEYRLNSSTMIFFVIELFLLYMAILGSSKVVIGIFAVLILLASFAVFFKKSIAFLYFLLFSIFMGSLGQVNVGVKIPELLIVEIALPVVTLFFFIKILFGWERGFRVPKPAWLFVPFLIWALFGFLVSSNGLRVLSVWQSYFAGMVMFVFSYNAISNKKQIQNLIVSFIVWGVVQSLIEFWVLFQLGGLQSGMVGLLLQKNLMITSYGRSNYLASFFVLLVPISTAYLLTSNDTKQRIFSSLAILLMMTGLILTLSRGAILALIIAMILFFSRTIKIKTFIPILFIIVVVAVILILNPLTNVLFERISSAEDSVSYFSRISYYKEVWGMFLKNPLTGVGMGSLGYHATFVEHELSPAHNIVLALLGEVGIVGAVFFLGLLFSVPVFFYSKYLKLRDERKKIMYWGFITAFIGCIIHGMVEPTLEGFTFSIVFWAAVGTLYRLSDFDSPEAINTYE